MPRGVKKHLKRLNAPKKWMLAKMGGVWAPKPSAGPHKSRECLPLVLILRNRLKYALTGDEVQTICMRRLVEVDGKVRTDTRYPAGFMDVISMPKAGDNFRLLYDTKGRFVLHRILEEEAKYKVCKVVKKAMGRKKVPYIVTHDGRTIRYPDPLIKVNDSVKVSIETGKVMEDGVLKWDVGALCMIVKGRNAGRVGVITAKEKHLGSFDIVYVKDSTGHMFATRMTSVFIIGKDKPAVSLPKRKGIKLSILEERAMKVKQ